MAKSIMFVGMDVHTKVIDITTAEDHFDGEVRHFGCIGGDLKSLDKALDKRLEGGRELRVVYEAGPGGFVIYRHLKERGIDCAVVSPAGVSTRKSKYQASFSTKGSRRIKLSHSMR